MKKLILLLITMLFLTGCVASLPGFQGRTDSAFFLKIKDTNGNEIHTGVVVDPEYAPELTKMYAKLMASLQDIIKELN